MKECDHIVVKADGGMRNLYRCPSPYRKIAEQTEAYSKTSDHQTYQKH